MKWSKDNDDSNYDGKLMILLMLQQWWYWRFWYLAFSSEFVSKSDQIWLCNVMSTITITCLTFIRHYLLGKMDHWSVDSSNARNWYTNKWTLVVQLIKPLSNWSEQPFTQAACTFDYVYKFRILSLVFARNPIVTGFREV